ncbi:MAG: hypothetical protein IPN76_03565 [Saprospiraceae bacterium]|nr:hypothetical protein [Saprospiraceae bacterium]
MNLVRVMEAQLDAGSGNLANNPRYYVEDVIAMRDNQYGTRDAEQVNVIYQGQEVTALIGLDGQGNRINLRSELLILPCPPYCGKGEGAAPYTALNNSPHGSITITFAQARQVIQNL